MKKFLQFCEETDKRVGLDYLKSIQSGEPFDVSVPLFHLTNSSNFKNVLRDGLIPTKPRASKYGGMLKGEAFPGVWLTDLDDIEAIVDLHMLPRSYYDGILLRIDATKLDPEKFSIGIEIPPKLLIGLDRGEKISRNEYLRQSNEIVYLDVIPPEALEEKID